MSSRSGVRYMTRWSIPDSELISELDLDSRKESTLNIKNMTNVGFILAICCICLQQCYSQVSEYLKYPTRVQVTHTYPTSSLWTIPGVTICNSNRIRMDRLSEEEPKLGQEFDALLSNKTISSQSKFTKIAKQIVDVYFNTSQIMWNWPLSRLFLFSKGSMIRDINCNFIWGPQYNCENFRIVESFQDGFCYTLFYHGTTREAIARGRASDFNTSLLGGYRKISSFQDYEIVEILVDFEPLQQADFQQDLGGKLVIHSTGHVGSVRDTYNLIKPGFNYDVIVRRTVSKRLPPPYKSMCRDYRGENLYKFIKFEGTYPSTPLDKTTCNRNCILNMTLSKCGCWPVEVPFFQGDPNIRGVAQYKTCPWNSNGDVQQNKSQDTYIDCYKRFHSFCSRKCNLGCYTEDYRVNVLSSTWPPVETFLDAKNSAERVELQRLRRCCARISIKFLEFMENQHIMYPSVTEAQLISNIGGIVSALIGVSAVTVYRFITRRVLGCRVVSNYNPNSSPDNYCGST